MLTVKVQHLHQTYEVEDLFALAVEAGLRVSLHDALACPLPDAAAQVGLLTAAHLALATEGLQTEQVAHLSHTLVNKHAKRRRHAHAHW